MSPKRSLKILAGAVALTAAAPAAASAAMLTGVDDSNRLLSFNSSSPKQVSQRAITGLMPGELIVALDRRPANDQLYALSNTSRIYTVDRRSAQAVQVGPSPLNPSLLGDGFGWDFNPVVDRIRLTSNLGQNLRLQPDTGVIAATDRNLAYAADDPSARTAPAITGAAYTNSVAGATTTQLLDIDTANDVLALQDPPNDGGLKTIGKLGVGNVTNPVAFDIGARGEAFATLKIRGKRGTMLYTIDVKSGQARKIGKVGKIRKDGRNGSFTLLGLTVTG